MRLFIGSFLTHFKRNILRYVKADHKKEVAEDLREVFLTGQKAYGTEQARQQLDEFARRWGARYDHIRKLAGRQDLHYYFTYLDYDRCVQSMIYTTNWIERLNKSFRRSTKIRNALPNPEAALLLLSKVAVGQEDGRLRYTRYIPLNLTTPYFQKMIPKYYSGDLTSGTLFWTVSKYTTEDRCNHTFRSIG